MLSRSGIGVRAAVALAASCAGAALFFTVTAPEAQEGSDSTAGTTVIASLEARIATLDPEVRRLKDRRDIFDALKRYTRGADRHDKDLVRSAFWPEATISFGRAMGLDEYVDWEEGELSGYAAHQHHITGQTIEIDGDTAHVESYVVYFLVPRDRGADTAGAATPGRVLLAEKTRLGSGRYVERWERRNGDWRILVREYVEDLALLGESVDLCANGGCFGTWDRNDLSYDRPLELVTPEQRQALADANRSPRNPQGATAR
jgi:hypothetical protein